MNVFDDNVRNIIGSFHPSRPILTNEEIYTKILELNPEFSIKTLLLRYQNWSKNKTENGELYHKLMDLSFSALCASKTEYISLLCNNGRTSRKLIKLLDAEEQTENISVYEDATDTVTINIDYEHKMYEPLYEALVQYINNDLCHPGTVRPVYNDGYMLEYSHIVEPVGEGKVDNIDEYVDEIKKYDPSFGLSQLYYNILAQYNIAKKLDEKYIPIITSYLPKITHITYDINSNSGTVSFNNMADVLYQIDDVSMDVYKSIIANLYHGINTADIEFHSRNGNIEVDTLENPITF